MKRNLINKDYVILSLFLLIITVFIIINNINLNQRTIDSLEIHISEQETEKGKIIIVSAPDDLNYEDVLSYTELSKEVPAGKIHLYHLVDGEKQEVEVKKYDKNNNGLIDYVEWIVPHLSEQTYELIIEISSAEHLDSNRDFISDIYERVKAIDNITYTIPENQYVRAYFETNLTSENVIDIFVHNVEPATIEVYEKDSDVVVGRIENVLEGVYYIGLEFEGSQDVFDLKSVGGEIIYDYVHDAPNQVQYFFGVTGGTTTALLDTLEDSEGTGQAIWQSVTQKGNTDNVIFVKQYAEETTITNAVVTAGVWCDKSAAEGGDSIKLSMEFYDCGTSSDCSSGLTEICKGTASAIDCDNGGGGTPEFETGTCTPSGSTTIEANHYIGVKFIAVENKNTAHNQIYYNTTQYNSYINFTEDVSAGNTCTKPESGNWAITCSDNCVWDSDFTVPDNITITGSGTLTWNANMTFTKPHWEIYKEDGCEIVVNSGGSIK